MSASATLPAGMLNVIVWSRSAASVGRTLLASSKVARPTQRLSPIDRVVFICIPVITRLRAGLGLDERVVANGNIYAQSLNDGSVVERRSRRHHPMYDRCESVAHSAARRAIHELNWSAPYP